jgi:hypothetical protein
LCQKPAPLNALRDKRCNSLNETFIGLFPVFWAAGLRAVRGRKLRSGKALVSDGMQIIVG